MSDARNVPTYELTEAAHYLHLPPSTLGHWIRGHKSFKRVLQTPPHARARLSFVNLVEAHMLATIRRKYRISLQHIRPAIDYLKREFKQPHPLATMTLEADEVNLFIRHAGKLLNISKQGQIAMKEAVEAHLQRVVRDEDSNPRILYPFVGGDYSSDRKPVSFDPDVSFGRLTLVETGIPTVEVAERFWAGETIEELAEDFGLSRLQIEDAVRCEPNLKAAA